MKQDMLYVDGEIQHHDPGHCREPRGRVQGVEQPPALFLPHQGRPYGGGGEKQPHQDGVQHDDPEVGCPAPGLGYGEFSPGHGQLPQGHRGEDPEEESEADELLLFQ